jgi:hypothetical protein
MSGEIVIDTPEGIQAFRLLALKGRLKLELAGLGFRGPSAFAMVKREFNLKGNKQSVYDQYVQMLKDRNILSN